MRAKAQAADLAREVPGVKGARNELRQKSLTTARFLLLDEWTGSGGRNSPPPTGN
jgi:hypothetical protein